MKTTLSVRRLALTLPLALLGLVQANGQMKIGSNPTQIHKASILELESNQQGLLLTRIGDFSLINTAIGGDNVDGMVVYYTGASADGPGLYMRKDGNWVKIASAADAASNWSLKGNAGTDPANNFVGTTDAQPLVFKTAGTERLKLTADGKIVTSAVGAGVTGDLNVLLIQADGTIVQRTLPADVFSNVITGITDGTTKITNADVTFAADASTSNESFQVTTDAATKTATIKAPVMDGSGTKTYGFMTKDDWDKLNNMMGINGLTIGSLLIDAAEAETDKAARITNDGAGNYEIHLVAANETHNGVVTTTAQTFAGDKTFDGTLKTEGNLIAEGTSSLVGNVTVGTIGAGGTASNLEVTGTTTLDGATTLGGTLNAANLGTDAASQDVLVKDGSGNIKTRALDISAFKPLTFVNDPSGTDLSVDETTDPTKVQLKVPDASPTARGVLTTGSQELGGAKTFVNDLAVGGSGAPANLTVTGDGSISGNGTVGGTLGVTGAATLNSTLDVKGTTQLEQTVTLNTVDDAATAATYSALVLGTSGAVEKTVLSADAGKSLEVGKEAGTENDLHIDRTTDATKTIIQVPDAGEAVRGVVNHDAQTFAGEKTFKNNTAIGNGTDAASLTVANGTTDLKGNTTIGESSNAAILTVNGSVATAVATASSTTYSLSGANAKIHTLLVDASGGGVAITLPQSTDLVDGVIYTITIIKNSATMNDVTVSGGTFADGHTAMKFWNAGSSRTIQNKGGTWYIIGQ